MNFSVCIEMIFQDTPFEERIRKVYAAGFNAVEFWGWKDKDIPKLHSVATSLGVDVVNFSGHRRGDLICKETHTLILEEFQESLSVAETLGCNRLMFLTNELGEEGRVVNSYPNIPYSEKRANLVEGLKEVSKLNSSPFSAVLEPLNTILDHKGYFLDSIEEAASIIDDVGSSDLSLLCDLYHQGVMGDNLYQIIKQYSRYFGHIHIADFPGRGEPGSERQDWKQVIEALGESGYQGYVGFEFAPQKSSEEALENLAQLRESLTE